MVSSKFDFEDHYAEVENYKIHYVEYGQGDPVLFIHGKPKESFNFALELQEGLNRIKFPILWIKADPGVVISKNNPIGKDSHSY